MGDLGEELGVKIVVETGECRNGECGDWYEEQDGTIKIRVLDMPLESFIAVAIHELIEKILCDRAGITDQMVTMFDAQHVGMGEAGDDPRSPYREPHGAATFAERAVCGALNLPWDKHCFTIESCLR